MSRWFSLASLLSVALVVAVVSYAGCSTTAWQVRRAAASDSDIHSLQEARRDLTAQRAELIDAFGPDHSSVRTADHQIEQIDQMIELRRQQIRRDLAAQHRARRHRR